MKKSLLWIVVIVLSISMVAAFSLYGCKAEEAVVEEEAVEEAPAEEVAEEAPAEEVTLYVINTKGGNEEESLLLDTLDDEFESAHPGVTIQREYQEFTEWDQVSNLRLTSEGAPDIFPCNNGESGMGLMVKADLLLDLTPYAEELGWFDRINRGALNVLSYTSDGMQFGEGNLYAIAPIAEVVGVLYNRQKFADAGVEIPSTYEEFVALLEMFKEKGEIPIVLGNLDGWPAIHVLMEIANVYLEDRQWEDDYIFWRNNVSFNIPENVQAATEFMEWVDKGYLIDGFEGMSYDDSVTLFASGQGAMYVGGSWIGGSLATATDVDNFGFFAIPPREGRDWKMTPGSLSLASAVHANTPYPDLAVEYLDYCMLSSRAAELWAALGQVPAVPDISKMEEGTFMADVATVWANTTANNATGHYMDWASPTMFDTMVAAVQEMIEKLITPEEYVQTIDANYQAYLAERQQK